MKAVSDKWLVKFANDLIGVLRVRSEHARSFDPLAFRRGVERDGRCLTKHLAEKVLPGKLGEIIDLTRHDTIYGSDWRRTPSQACCELYDFPTLSEMARVCSGQHVRMFLARNARPVVYAAMYDILATQHFIVVRDTAWGQGMEPQVEYRPPSSLEQFVRGVRLRRTHLAA